MKILMIINLLLASVVLSCSATRVFADDNPFYENAMLIIPSVDAAEGAGTFQDVVIELTDQGELLLIDFNDGIPLRPIENVELIQTESFPVQIVLKVSGLLTSGCLEIGQINHRVVDNRIEVIVYYLNNIAITNPGTITCTTDVRAFTEFVPLPVYGLAQGSYEYSVNGEFLGEFTLSDFNGF